MLRNPRTWCWAAGGWLVLMGALHLALHVWGIVLEHAMIGQQGFAMQTMKQAFSLEPLQPSLWRRHRMLNVSLGFFFVFAGAVPCLLAWLRADDRLLAGFALFATVFWTAVFLPYAFLDPVALPLVTAALAVPLHGTAWLTATYRVLTGGTGHG